MKMIILLFIFFSFSCNRKNQINILEFKNTIIAKRVKYENSVYECLSNFSDGGLKKLNNLLCEDKSFISLYTIQDGDVYYSSNNFKVWNYVNYQYCKESLNGDILGIKYSLGLLSYGNNIDNGGVTVTNYPSTSQSIDSVICFEYSINEYSPLVIFFDAKKMKKISKIVSDDKITAKSSYYTTGNYILIDTISNNNGSN